VLIVDTGPLVAAADRADWERVRELVTAYASLPLGGTGRFCDRPSRTARRDPGRPRWTGGTSPSSGLAMPRRSNYCPDDRRPPTASFGNSRTDGEPGACALHAQGARSRRRRNGGGGELTTGSRSPRPLQKPLAPQAVGPGLGPQDDAKAVTLVGLDGLEPSTSSLPGKIMD
jgi:hypothetical protein